MTTEKQTGIERLRTLYAIMAGVPQERVDLRGWRGSCNNFTDRQLLEGCGTKACAVGWACAHPEFQAQGLGYDIRRGAPQFAMHNETGEVMLYHFEAVQFFFGLEEYEAVSLFTYWRGATSGDPEVKQYIRSGEFELAHKNDHAIVMRRIRRLLLRKGAITPERNAELATMEGMPA